MPGRPRNQDYPGEKTLTVTQVRSGIGNKPKAMGTLRALGLGRIGKTNTLPDRPEIRGMLARVPHLITVVDESTTSGRVTATDQSPSGAKELKES
jgi:large subunit ribosomal protein L30